MKHRNKQPRAKTEKTPDLSMAHFQSQSLRHIKTGGLCQISLDFLGWKFLSILQALCIAENTAGYIFMKNHIKV